MGENDEPHSFFLPQKYKNNLTVNNFVIQVVITINIMSTFRPSDSNANASKDAAVPLLEESSAIEALPNWRSSAVVLGLLVGIIVQLATVGINTLVLAAIGSDVLQRNNIGAVVLPIIYNGITLIAVWATLAVYRTVLKSSNHLGRQSNEDKLSEENPRFEGALMQFEGHFVLGSVFGASMLWLVVNLVLGTSSRMFFALLPLNVILCVYMLLGFIAESSTGVQTDDEETGTTSNGSSYRNGPYDV